MRTQTRHRGFTLIEMLIYVAFLASVSVLSVNAIILTMKSFYALRISQSVNESATVGLERISREVRNAYDIDLLQSTFGSNPGRLTLNTKDSGGNNTTVEFYVNGGTLFFKEGGIDKGPLMTTRATLSSLVFRQATTTKSKAIKVEMTLADNYGGVAQSASFYDTIILRGSVR